MSKLPLVGGIVATVGAAAGLPIAASTDWFAALGGKPQGERLERMKASPQYGEDVFVNPRKLVIPVESDPATMWTVSREYLFSSAARSPSDALPVSDPREILAERPASGLRITWLGHSTLLIEIDGRRVLTDPVWGLRASPSTLVGPKRFHPAPLALSEVGELDAVLISHDHYDHLDYPTILELRDTDVPFYAPLGVGAHLETWGVPAERIRELDWWDEARVGGLRLVSTPAQHFSGRGVLDRNSTLWTSWAVIGEQHRVYFSGDTGMMPQFAEIGERLGPFDVAMLEVGAYHDAWGAIHLGPRQAVEANRLVRGHVMLPIHWGTFDLGIHAWQAPGDETRHFAAEAGVTLATPRLGQPIEPAVHVPVEKWWDGLR